MPEFSVVYLLPTKRENILRRSGALPFIPHAGLMLDPGDGNYYKVEEVYYKTDTRLIEVWFENDGAHAVRTLKQWGWKARA